MAIMASTMPLAGCSGSDEFGPEVSEAVRSWTEEVYWEALETMAADAGIGFYRDGVPGALPETYPTNQGPRLADFAVNANGPVFNSPEAQAKYVSQSFEVNGQMIEAKQIADDELEVMIGPRSKGGAETLMVVHAFASGVEPDYYNTGIDRVTVTTVVFVIDLESRGVLHVEYLGTQTPGEEIEGSGGAKPNWGRWMSDEALAYADSLMG